MDEIGLLSEAIQGISDDLNAISGTLEEIGDVEVGEISPSDIGAAPVARRRKFRATDRGASAMSEAKRKTRSVESRLKDVESALKQMAVKSKGRALSAAVSSAGRDEHEVSATLTATTSTTYQLPKAQDATRANIAVIYADVGTITVNDMTHLGNSLFSRGSLARTIAAGKSWAFGFADRIINSQDDLGAVVGGSAVGDKFSVQYLYAEPATKALTISQFCKG